jgi:glycosyltransferase involved in cell wall biosynthesis
MRFSTIATAAANIISNVGCDLSYVVESAGWSIYEDGRQIVEQLNRQKLLRARIADHPFGLWGQIIHFGSEHVLFGRPEARGCGRPQVLTVFHVVENYEGTRFLPELAAAVDIVHTACDLTVAKLVRLGVPHSKIVKVPLGVDTELFRPPSREERTAIRRILEIPDGAVAVGSFQKDGVGWGNGDEPKLIKGPDIFCDALERLARRYPVYVVLTGPARGYVKQRLAGAGIPFTHRHVQDFKGLYRYYHALDLYLVTSRNEGGPKAVLESLASGVPLVTTAVGMAPEVVQDGVNGRICAAPDPEAIVAAAASLLDDAALRTSAIKAGLVTSKKYPWAMVAARYYQALYAPLLGKAGR